MAKRKRKKPGSGAFGKNRGTQPARASSPPDNRKVVTPEFIAERDAAMAAIARKLEKQPFQDAADMKAFLHAHLTGKSFDEIFAEEEATAEDSPQRRARLELRKIHPSHRPEVQRRHAKLALEHDPDNIEAWSALASTFANATKFEDACRKAVDIGRRVFADRIEAVAKGGPGLWEFVDCRPFLGACQKLGEFYVSQRRREEAIQVFGEVLAWNPGDNQGIRYDLLHELLTRKDLDGAEALLDAYPDDHSLQWAYDRAWTAFMRVLGKNAFPELGGDDGRESLRKITTGPFAPPTKLLRKAFREFPAGPLFILDLRSAFGERLSGYTWNQPSEAHYYAWKAVARWVGPEFPAIWLIAAVTENFQDTIPGWDVNLDELWVLDERLDQVRLPEDLNEAAVVGATIAGQMRAILLQQAEPGGEDRENAPGTSTRAGVAFRLHISLDHVKPPIWRRVLIPGDVTLDKLHHIIQLAMGWDDEHLHQFRFGKKIFQPPDPRTAHRLPLKEPEGDTTTTFLGDLISQPGGVLKYEYDFGDGWEHTIKVEEILRGEDVPALPDPVCLAGRRQCPPEDCGGPFRYVSLVDTFKDPGHPDHEDALDWFGEEFDPEDFDPDETTGWLEGVLEEEDDGSD